GSCLGEPVGQELPLRAAHCLCDQFAVLPAENPFQGFSLFDSTVVRARGLVEIEDPAPVHRVFGLEGKNTDEVAPVLVTTGGSGFADPSDYDGVVPFHAARWISANTVDGPEAGWSRIGQVGLDVMVGEGRVHQNMSDTGDPLG